MGRLFKIAVIWCISGLTLVGCSLFEWDDPATQSKKDITIEYWTTPLYQNIEGEDEHGGWEKAKIAEFQKENPNVKINFLLVPSDSIEQKVTVAALGNRLPDVLLDGLDRRIMKYVQFGKSEEISDFIADDIDDYTKMALDIVSRDGRIYGVPTTISPIHLYLNRKIFRDKGLEHLIPEEREWTFEEWQDAMRQVSGDGIYGTAIYASNEQGDEMPLLYLFGNGVEMWNEDSTKIILDQHKEAASEVINMFKDMMKEGSIVPGASSLNAKDGLDMFKQGKIATFVWGQSLYRSISIGQKSGIIDKDFELYGMKPIHRDGFPSKWALSLHGYTVFEQTDPEKREMVKKLIQFMTSRENTKLLAEASHLIPARVSASYESESEDREETLKLLNETPVANIGTGSPYYADVRALWYLHLQAALLDNMTAEEAIDEFTRKANELIQEKMQGQGSYVD